MTLIMVGRPQCTITLSAYLEHWDVYRYIDQAELEEIEIVRSCSGVMYSHSLSHEVSDWRQHHSEYQPGTCMICGAH